MPVAEKDPNIRVLFPAMEKLPEYVRIAIVTTDAVIQKKPELLRAYMVASARGVRYAIENRAEAIALAANLSKIKPDDPGLALTYDHHLKLKLVNPNGEISAARIQYMQEANRERGSQDKVLPIEKVANFDFQKEIIKQLGPYKGEWLA